MKIEKLLKSKTENEITDGLAKLHPNEKLLQCATNGHLDGVKEALQQGANMEYIRSDDPSTSLDKAIENGHYELALYLLDQGSTVGNFALENAFDRVDIFKTLLKRLSPDMCNRESLDWAFESAGKLGNVQCIKLMEERISQECDF